MACKNTKFVKLFLTLFLLSFLLTPNVFGQPVNEDYSTNEEIRSLNGEISTKQDIIKKKKDEQDALKKALAEKQQEKASLSNQLAILENRIEKIRLDVESAELEIDKTNLEIQKTGLEIEDANRDIDNEKQNISNALNLMHKKEEVSTIEILLLNSTLSEFLNQVKYLENINSELKESLTKLNELKISLDKKNVQLGDKKNELDKFKKSLEEKKTAMLAEEENQTFLLEQTKSSEAEYQRLLRLAKQEQERAAADIANLERTVREKLAQMSKDKLQFNDTGFNWPCPKNVVTAYFHDPDYPFRKVFEHPAIDIRAKQGTTLRAPASGYVARAKDSGMGYSYIMLVHGNGLSTVYGHVSRIDVNEDEFVVQGQVIGASGGMPGTPGAGNLTTGPHLHFEVRLNGLPVNPLEYLP